MRPFGTLAGRGGAGTPPRRAGGAVSSCTQCGSGTSPALHPVCQMVAGSPSRTFLTAPFSPVVSELSAVAVQDDRGASVAGGAEVGDTVGLGVAVSVGVAVAVAVAV